MNILNRVLALFFPGRQECIICGSKVFNSQVCAGCVQKLKSLQGVQPCKCCGRYTSFRQGEIKTGYLCQECQRNPPYFTRARSVGPYRGVLKDAIYKFKYEKHRSLAEIFGAMMAEAFVKEPAFVHADIFLPVPLSTAKMLSRGFNQSELLAHRVSRLLAIPVGDCITRTKDTPSMSKLGRKEREVNITGIFQIKGSVKNKKIVLIDDILTTGSTAGECSSILLHAGAASVGVLTIASGVQEKNQ